MRLKTTLSIILAASAFSAAVAEQPNILWILTDDHRFDSIRAFNKMLSGQEMSELGYVESPQTDKLAASGTTFINAYCHAQGCAPSRASMHYGRYPFRTGIYEFEYHNNNLPHFRPSLPEQMAELGYQTFHVGKLGVRVRTLKNGRPREHRIYEQDISFKIMAKDGLTDWTKGEVDEVNGIKLDEPVHCDWFFSEDGSVEYSGAGLNDLEAFKGHSKRIDKKYDLLRGYNAATPKKYGANLIIGGVSSQPAGKTRDGVYTTELIRFLENPNETLTVGSQTYQGVDPEKPLFAHIGYDFPHTPVLPPASFRKRFQQKTYRVPEFDPAERENLPEQLRRLSTYKGCDHYTPDEMQQMIQDYYAFCAYGDDLVGRAAEAFVKYSKKQGQPWMIVYVCGDHGWKLNEHGAISKFSPWKIDAHDPIVVVSSDKKAFPAGKVVTDLTEFVDIAPTILAAGGADLTEQRFDYLDGYDLAGVVAGKQAPRDYILTESHAVTGPRASIRTPEYMFSVKVRPDRKKGQNIRWALEADYEELEPVLYHLPSDPHERTNLAYDEDHRAVADAMREKLLNIVLGDNRVEINWEKWGTGTNVFLSNFAPGADDKKLNLNKGDG